MSTYNLQEIMDHGANVLLGDTLSANSLKGFSIGETLFLKLGSIKEYAEKVGKTVNQIEYVKFTSKGDKIVVIGELPKLNLAEDDLAWFNSNGLNRDGELSEIPFPGTNLSLFYQINEFESPIPIAVGPSGTTLEQLLEFDRTAGRITVGQLYTSSKVNYFYLQTQVDFSDFIAIGSLSDLRLCHGYMFRQSRNDTTYMNGMSIDSVSFLSSLCNSVSYLSLLVMFDDSVRTLTLEEYTDKVKDGVNMVVMGAVSRDDLVTWNNHQVKLNTDANGITELGTGAEKHKDIFAEAELSYNYLGYAVSDFGFRLGGSDSDMGQYESKFLVNLFSKINRKFMINLLEDPSIIKSIQSFVDAIEENDCLSHFNFLNVDKVKEKLNNLIDNNPQLKVELLDFNEVDSYVEKLFNDLKFSYKEGNSKGWKDTLKLLGKVKVHKQ